MEYEADSKSEEEEVGYSRYIGKQQQHNPVVPDWGTDSRPLGANDPNESRHQQRAPNTNTQQNPLQDIALLNHEIAAHDKSEVFCQETIPPSSPDVKQALSDATVVATLRWLMTGTAALLLCSAILSMLVASQYRLILICGWIVIGVLFVSFSYVLQETVLQSNRRARRRVFHPAVHAVADWLVSGVTDFVDDCRDEHKRIQLLLTNYPNNPPEIDGVSGTEQVNIPQRQPRTRLFRVFVQPVLQLRLRRQHRRSEKRQSSRHNATVEAYEPPVFPSPSTELS